MHAHGFRIENELYNQLYAELRGEEDIPRLSEKYRVTQHALRAIYSQKLVRSVRKQFHLIKARARRLYSEWRQGKTFSQLAREYSFSPLIMASILLQCCAGWSKRKWSEAIRFPDRVSDARIRTEIKQALASDPAFSPSAHENQKRNACSWENQVAEWLHAKKVRFLTEKDRKSAGGKTPDFLLQDALEWSGLKLKWVECKASFGDEIETRRNLENQLKHYLRLWGPGMVIYFHGTVARPTTIPSVVVETREVLHK
ncbi:MAG: TPD domain-containing protein [Candidatus Norongarragalinales archaeon]